MPLTVTVVPDVTGLDKTFDYLVPEELRFVVELGSSVRAPLHGRRITGWVVRVGPPSADVSVDRLVPLAGWAGHGPAADLIDLSAWAADRWGTPRRRPFLVTASPPRRVRAIGASRERVHVAFSDAASGVRSLLARAPHESAPGGVVRVSPTDDVMSVVLAAVERGSTLVVHPSPAAVGLLAARLRAVGVSVAVMPDEWALAAAGADVVIGGRSAAWAPVPNLAVAVVLDEHDEALQEERSPTWHARDVLVERTRRAGVPCVLVSPCPTVTALAWSGSRWMRPAPEVEAEGWPTVEVVDRRDDEPWKRSLVTTPLIEVLRDPARRVACVHNVPGRARMLACRSCRSLLACERCHVAVRQLDDGVLHCARCGLQRPPVCQVCGSAALANVRPGITRLREELEAAANRPVGAVAGTDRGAATQRNVDVFVGTEAVLHRVNDVDVVVFLDFDAELLAPRYRAGEQALALLVRAARLVGPRRDGGHLIVQTTMPDHEVVQAAVRADPGGVVRAEAARRRDLALPPFGALAHVSGEGAERFVTSTGLVSAPDATGLLLRADSWDELGPVIAATPRELGSRLRIEVDPARR